MRRNHKQYRPRVVEVFNSFLKGETKEADLINTLSAIERNLKQGARTEKQLWFKFFKGDTLATTVQDVLKDLYSNNNSWIRESMQMSINNPKELQIYYS